MTKRLAEKAKLKIRKTKVLRTKTGIRAGDSYMHHPRGGKG
jgi:hypothetical protein